MSAGLYTSLSGALANLDQVETVANNIANSDTTGFKRHQIRFDTILGAALPYARTAETRLDLSAGTSRPSGSPIHAAIDGPGFFVVRTEGGEELYTRRGDFRVGADGILRLPNGLEVQGGGGAITLPAGTPSLASNGTLAVNGAPVGRLRIVRFDSPEFLQKAGDSTVRAPAEAQIQEAENTRVAAGFVETSNVSLSSELVSLILAQRSFEASMNALRINDELTQTLIQDAQS